MNEISNSCLDNSIIIKNVLSNGVLEKIDILLCNVDLTKNQKKELIMLIEEIINDISNNGQ